MFCVKAQVIVPAFVPLEPEVIESQLPPEITDAVQFIDPPPLLETLNDVEPESDDILRLLGCTSRTGVLSAACVTVTSFGLPVAPEAVTRIVPVR